MEIFKRKFVSKKLLVAIDFHSMETKYNGSQWLPFSCLVTHVIYE